ncbi:MAG TPA: EAL domain-containing protein [Paucimonas sp.]|nr:EAL domain-containing protein [Paucimonas sp.]
MNRTTTHLDSLEARNERLSLTLQSSNQLAFDWLIEEDQLQFTSGIPCNFSDVPLAAITTTAELRRILHQDDWLLMREPILAALKNTGKLPGTFQHLPMRLADASLGWRWVEMSGTVVQRDAAGRAIRAVGMLTDISARKQAERQAIRLGNLYVALRRTNHAILRMQQPEMLFEEICRIAVKHGEFHLASIRQFNPATRLLEQVASYGSDSSAFQALEVSVDSDQESGQGPSGTAFRENRPQICNDLFGLRFSQIWKNVARELGLNSFASFPFCREGRPVGVLVLYSVEKNFFDHALIGLLQEMTQEISFALDNFEQQIRRTAMELALAESEKRKDAIFRASLDCIVSFDDTGNLIDFNPAAERTFGYQRDAIIGQPLADLLIAPESRERQKQGIAQFLATGGSPLVNRRAELRAMRADGTLFPIEIAVAPIQLADKRIFTAYIRDITELKESQATLQESEARYRQIVRLSPEAMYIHFKGRFSIVSDALVRLFGASDASVLLGKEVLPFLHPDYRKLAAFHVRQLKLDAARPMVFNDTVWLRLDGTPFNAELSASKFLYMGKPAIQVVVRDITARKRAEELQLAQNSILHMIASGAVLANILATLGKFIEARSEQWLCAVQILNTEGTLLRTAAAPSLPAGYQELIATMPIASSGCAFGTAVSRRQPVSTVSANDDPLWATQSGAMTAHGLRAGFLRPILGRNNKTLGVLSLYHREPRAPGAVELQLIEIAAHLAGIAIENKEADDRIRFLAHYDEMTALPNRVLFNQILNHAMKNALRHARKLAVLFVDLDRFKNINDTLGHDAGDLALQEFARRMRICLREADTLARMGGDEFFILIEDLEEGEYAAAVAQKILDQAAIPFAICGQECHLTGSIGIAIYPDDGTDAQSLLKNADIAMYRAKDDGKNTYHFYSASNNAHSLERLTLESQLRRAIDNDELVLHYQPKVALASGRITGAEALVRWQHPELGLLPPNRFIPLAEETQLIIPLSKRIMEIACCDALTINAAAPYPLRIAVNLSARQFDDPEFIPGVQSLLADTGLPPHLLQFEITESMVMQDPEHAVQIMDQLLGLGIHLDIDDFGTGYSSLANLKRFPVDNLKIDRSFVQDIPNDPSDTAITKAIIAMAHSMEIRVIAEGVETREQMEALRRFGCDEFQGYHFSRPIPMEAFLTLQKNHLEQDKQGVS